ncbi:hypothetical protein VM98_33905, partial [Streptomyces rubellomurinus subsp. indigoferus]
AVLVPVYLAPTVSVLATAPSHLLQSPDRGTDWSHALTAAHGAVTPTVGAALTVFPQPAPCPARYGRW